MAHSDKLAVTVNVAAGLGWVVAIPEPVKGNRSMTIDHENADAHAAGTAIITDLRERRRVDTRREITAAALDLFERNGFAGTTVDEISRAAGVSPRTFFRYFENKEESVLRIHRQFEDDISDWLVDTVSEDLILSQVEMAHEKVIEQITNGTPDGREILLRTRRLVIKDPSLRSAALVLDSTSIASLIECMGQKMGADVDPMVPRLLIEMASATMRVAFDEWAVLVDAGEDVELIDVYRRTRTTLRAITALS